jgi:hypothetical protein
MMEDNIIEEWKEIPSCVGYEASTLGRVRNKKTGRVLKGTMVNGYIKVAIIKPILIHRLIAETWIPNTENKPTVNHISGIKTDNNINNLQWATYKEQSKHIKENNLRNNFCSQKIKIIQYDLNGVFLREFNTLREVATFLGINKQVKNITRKIKNGKNIAFGYIWEEIKESDLEGEIWKQMNEIHKKYYISNYGRVKSNNGRILKSYDRCGYENIVLNKKKLAIHRLVALYFIPNLENKEMVNHKNGIKNDNNSNNLEWVSRIENVKHAMENNLIKTKNILHYDINGIILNIYKSSEEVSKIFNIERGLIVEMCNGNYYFNHKLDFMFKYIDENDDLINMLTNIDKINIKKRKIVDVYNKDGLFLETMVNYINISKKYKVKSESIRNQCEGLSEGKQCKYVFRYHGDSL